MLPGERIRYTLTQIIKCHALVLTAFCIPIFLCGISEDVIKENKAKQNSVLQPLHAKCCPECTMCLHRFPLKWEQRCHLVLFSIWEWDNSPTLKKKIKKNIHSSSLGNCSL